VISNCRSVAPDSRHGLDVKLPSRDRGRERAEDDADQKDRSVASSSALPSAGCCSARGLRTPTSSSRSCGCATTPAEATCLFDLSEHRLHHLLSQSVRRFEAAVVDLCAHQLRQRSTNFSVCRCRVLGASRCDIAVDTTCYDPGWLSTSISPECCLTTMS
jgi:hypothetical protein